MSQAAAGGFAYPSRGQIADGEHRRGQAARFADALCVKVEPQPACQAPQHGRNAQRELPSAARRAARERALEQRFRFCGAAGRRAALRPGETEGAFADGSALRGVVQQPQQNRGQLFHRIDLQQSAGRQQIVGDPAEVLHRRPDDDGPLGQGRFEDVVAAPAVERSAHENDIGEGVQAGELAQGIEQQNRRQIGGRRGVELRAAHERQAVEGARRFVEALRVARRHDEERAPPAGRRCAERPRQQFLLAFAGAARDHDGAGRGVLEKRRQIVGDTGLGGGEVVLDVAADLRSLGRRAGRQKSLPVGFALRQDGAGAAQDRREERAQAGVARRRAVGHASVQQQRFRAEALGLQKIVGPDFRLDDDQQPRAQGAERAGYAPGKFQRRGEYGVGQAGELLPGELAPGGGGRADVKRRRGKAFAQPAQQRNGGQNFADRNRV